MNKINLLSEKYSRRAIFHTEIRRAAAIAVVAFLFWILIVLALTITERVFQEAIYRNQSRLQSEESAIAERVAKLAAAAQADNERYQMFGAVQNINPESILTVIALMEDISADEILADAEERTITISGRVGDKNQINEFIGRLNSRFRDVSLAALERMSGESLSFTVVIIEEDGL